MLTLLRKFFGPRHPPGTVLFIHHQPARGNVGDELCSPKHYFHLATERPVLAIVGGGVFMDFGVKQLRQANLSPQEAVLWGSGLSFRDPAASPAKISSLPHLRWGLRDLDQVVDEKHFLPCVSCLHPMLDIPAAADGTLLFLNIDDRVTSQEARAAISALAEARNWRLLFNDCTPEEIADGLASSRHLVTNSFHGAYWGLLSGHAITLMGYSSKFYSLFHALGLPTSAILRFDRGDAESLLAGIESVHDETQAVRLIDAPAKLAAFRARNMIFAEELLSAGILSICERRPA